MGIVSERTFRRSALPGFLLMGLCMPFVLASSVGVAVAAPGPVLGLVPLGDIPIVMIRPMTSGGLVAAKFGMAAASVLLAWAVTLAAVALLIVVVGYGGEMAESLGRLARAISRREGRRGRDPGGREPGWRSRGSSSPTSSPTPSPAAPGSRTWPSAPM